MSIDMGHIAFVATIFLVSAVVAGGYIYAVKMEERERRKK